MKEKTRERRRREKERERGRIREEGMCTLTKARAMETLCASPPDNRRPLSYPCTSEKRVYLYLRKEKYLFMWMIQRESVYMYVDDTERKCVY